MPKDKLWCRQVYQKNPNFVTRVIDEEMLLVPIKREVSDLESFYVLNETARFIWELMDGQSNLAQIKKKLMEEFEVSGETAEADLNKFIRELAGLGGITEID